MTLLPDYPSIRKFTTFLTTLEPSYNIYLISLTVFWGTFTSVSFDINFRKRNSLIYLVEPILKENRLAHMLASRFILYYIELVVTIFRTRIYSFNSLFTYSFSPNWLLQEFTQFTVWKLPLLTNRTHCYVDISGNSVSA